MNKLEEIKRRWEKDYPKSLYSGDIDWLVKQVEKYEQLKAEFEFKQSIIDEKHKLKEENQQLKTQLEYDNDNWFQTVQKLKKEIDELERENESLGKTLKDTNEYYIDVDKKVERYEKALTGLGDKYIDQQYKIARYEQVLQKIVEMDSPFYFRENQLETPFNYARVALEGR